MFDAAAEILYRICAILGHAAGRIFRRAFGWASQWVSATSIVIALATLVLLVIARLLNLWHAGVHKEYAGPGRVRFLSFFRGAGYCLVLHRGRGRDGKPLDAPGWRPNIVIPGFTIFVRTAKSRLPPHPGRGEPVRRFRVTTNPNRPVV